MSGRFRQFYVSQSVTAVNEIRVSLTEACADWLSRTAVNGRIDPEVLLYTPTSTYPGLNAGTTLATPKRSAAEGLYVGSQAHIDYRHINRWTELQLEVEHLLHELPGVDP